MPTFPEPPFVLFGTDHVVVLVLTVVTLVVLIGIGRRLGPESRSARWSKGVIAWTLLLSYPMKVLIYWMTGTDMLDNALPMHFCNWAAVIGFVALWYGKALPGELLYFWGLAGTLQAVLTPNIPYGFPHPVFIIFFLIHSGVVVAACFLVAGLRQHPRPGAPWRCFLWAQVYLVVASLVNWTTGSNYGFLARKPEQASLLDHLGNWPYYIVSLEVLCLILFFLLNLPFMKAQRRTAVEEA